MSNNKHMEMESLKQDNCKLTEFVFKMKQQVGRLNTQFTIEAYSVGGYQGDTQCKEMLLRLSLLTLAD